MDTKVTESTQDRTGRQDSNEAGADRPGMEGNKEKEANVISKVSCDTVNTTPQHMAPVGHTGNSKQPEQRERCSIDQSQAKRRDQASFDQSQAKRRERASFDQSQTRHRERDSFDQSQTKHRERASFDQSLARHRERASLDQSLARHRDSFDHSQYSFIETYLRAANTQGRSYLASSHNSLISYLADGSRKSVHMGDLPYRASNRMSTYGWQKDALERHLTRLLNARPKVDCAPPDLKLHSYLNYKRLHRFEVREKQLQDQNSKMVSRIANASCSTDKAKPHVDCWNTTRGLPFNARMEQRKREQARIAIDNDNLLKRLLKASPSLEISRHAQLEDYRKSRRNSIKLRQFPSLIIVNEDWDPEHGSTQPKYEHKKTKLPVIYH